MDLSVIIPAYNCESTISNCLDSILCNNNRYEIIVINDGSTDETYNILEEYSKKYDAIKLYHTSNSGVSEARNLGIKKAKGSYISFIDSDDYVRKDYIESILTYISSKKDLYFFKGTICDDKYNIEGYTYISKSNSIEDLRKNIILGKSNVPWDKVFKKSIIDLNCIKFRKGVSLGEDWVFTMDYIENINDFEIFDDQLYYYIIQKNSLSNRKMTINMFENQIYLVKRLIDFGSCNYESKKVALQLITSAASKLYRSDIEKKIIFDFLVGNDWYNEVIDSSYTDIKSNLRKFLMKRKLILIISLLFGKK